MAADLQALVRKFDEHMDAIGGCSDGYCLVKRPNGMHTNGGCRCLDDKYKARRVGRAAQELRASLSAALRAEAGSVGNQLLAECYKAMTSAMAVIDAEAAVGRTNANALNALAACRVAIERRDTDRVWRCQSCFRVFPRGQHKECRPRPSQKD